MTNVYDNAGHLERLGALARENEDLKRRLAELEKQQPVNERLVDEALAAAEAQQAEPVNERVIDRTWARFCGAFGDGPDAPYPGMIEAFETHYGQSFRDKDWRTEAACWAAAWHKAVLVANPQAEPVRLTDEQVVEICEALGEDYDCLRVWEAWGCGTMRPDDFILVADDGDRVVEICEAVPQALGPVEGAEPLKAEPVPVEAIGRLLTEAMDKAVENGASSVSMPDDYVAVAAWLCRVEDADNG